MGQTFAIKSGTRVGYLNAILARGGGGGNWMSQSSKVQIPGGVAFGDAEIWNCSVHYSSKGFFVGFLFLRPVTMYHVHFINLWA